MCAVCGRAVLTTRKESINRSQDICKTSADVGDKVKRLSYVSPCQKKT